MLFVLN